jgi:signal transduction histidine kinase
MVWNSIVMMSVFDVFFIGLAVSIIVLLFTRLRGSRLGGGWRSFALLAIGLVIWAGFYFIDLLIMLTGPFFLTELQSMELMQAWHHEARWFVDVVAFGCFGAGFILLVGLFGQKVGSLQESTDQLQSELHSRSNLKTELEADAMAQRAVSRSKSEFLFGLSHEMRTPLNGILGLASLLSNTELEDDQRKLLTNMERSAQAMLTRVKDLMDLSKLEIGRVEMHVEAFAPNEISASVDALFGPYATNKGLRLRSTCTESAKRSLVGDKTLIKQILSSLVSNAVKYTDQGSVDVTVDTQPSEGGRVCLILKVVDTGIGMDAEKIQRLSNNEPQLEDGELALGLSICWSLAELMDGDITIESEPGQGSTVEVRLQLQPDHEPPLS